MKIFILAIATLPVILAAQDAATEKKITESPAVAKPLVPDFLQRDFFRELSIYQNARANHEEALKTAERISKIMNEQEKKVNSASEAMRTACTGNFILSQEKLNRAIVECVEKPKPPTPSSQSPPSQ